MVLHCALLNCSETCMTCHRCGMGDEDLNLIYEIYGKSDQTGCRMRCGRGIRSAIVIVQFGLRPVPYRSLFISAVVAWPLHDAPENEKGEEVMSATYLRSAVASEIKKFLEILSKKKSWKLMPPTFVYSRLPLIRTSEFEFQFSWIFWQFLNVKQLCFCHWK